MADLTCKLLVIGAGPGGYVCAIRAGQLGVDTIIVEESALGGTCLNVGCIPSKALIHAADEFHRITDHAASSPLGISAAPPTIDFARTIAWKDAIVARLSGGVGALLAKAGVRVVEGAARLRDGKTVTVATADGQQRIRTEHLVIATGSAPVELPGSLAFGGPVISSSDALALERLPRRLAIVGAGYIGLEIGTALAKLGVAVTLVEAEDRILPLYDDALTRPLRKRLEALGVAVLTGVRAEGYADEVLAVKAASGETRTIAADKVLVTVGRRPRTGGIGSHGLGLTMAGPFIEIDEACRTSMRGVYAIGDVTGEPMLAHRAMAQGEMVAEIVAGRRRVWDRAVIPAVCFTDPEIVTAGLSPAEAAARGIAHDVAQVPFAASGRAMSVERTDGFVRVVARKETGVLIGIQAVGAGVSELSATFALAIEMGARADDIAATIHAHPTLSETLHEASLKLLGHALHV